VVLEIAWENVVLRSPLQGERTDNQNVWEENTEIEVIASFTANQRTLSVTCDL
uniref:Uncharacterized protein n=1 Tax=Amphimedon queenslandica TaxID=400682 RepID=A0A1X7VKH9_AMPQE